MEPSNAVAHILNQKNLWFDAEGTAAILPKALRLDELLFRGESMSDIDSEIAEGFIIVANVDKKQWTRRNAAIHPKRAARSITSSRIERFSIFMGSLVLDVCALYYLFDLFVTDRLNNLPLAVPFFPYIEKSVLFGYSWTT